MDFVNVLFKYVEKGVEKMKSNRPGASGAVSPHHQDIIFSASTSRLERRLEQCETRMENMFNELKNQQDAMQSKLQSLINHRL